MNITRQCNILYKCPHCGSDENLLIRDVEDLNSFGETICNACFETSFLIHDFMSTMYDYKTNTSKLKEVECSIVFLINKKCDCGYKSYSDVWGSGSVGDSCFDDIHGVCEWCGSSGFYKQTLVRKRRRRNKNTIRNKMIK